MPTGKDANGRKHERAGALSPPAFSLTFSNREALCAGFGSSGYSLAVVLVEAEEMRLTTNLSHIMAAAGVDKHAMEGMSTRQEKEFHTRGLRPPAARNRRHERPRHIDLCTR